MTRFAFKKSISFLSVWTFAYLATFNLIFLFGGCIECYWCKGLDGKLY